MAKEYDVLLVTDSSSFVKITKRFLYLNHLSFKIVPDIEEAFKVLDLSCKPKLILFDIIDPKIIPYQLLHKIKNDEELKGVYLEFVHRKTIDKLLNRKNYYPFYNDVVNFFKF